MARVLLGGDGLRAQLLRGGIGSLAIKAGHAVLALAVAVVLARTLGPEGYGVYSFALAILMLTSIPAQVGVPQLIIRETAKAQAAGNWGLIRGLWRWGNAAVAVCSLAAVFLVGVVLHFTDVGGDRPRVATLIVGIALIPVIALANVRGACLRGLRKVVQGQLPETIIRPALLLTLVGIWVALIAPEPGLTAEQAMGLYVIAAVIAFVIGVWLLRRSRPVELLGKLEPIYQSSAWRKAVMPLALITGLQLINSYADLIILGIFRSNEEVGIYRAVFQVAMLVIFGLQAMNQVVQPYFARLYQQGEHDRLQRLVTANARVTLFLATPPVALFVFFGEELIGWFFGDTFRNGALALILLAIGQLINASFGVVGPLLTMSEYERFAAKGMIISATTNVLLNFVLIPVLGMVGAALATAVSLLIWNFILWCFVRNKMGLNSSVWPVRTK